ILFLVYQQRNQIGFVLALLVWALVLLLSVRRWPPWRALASGAACLLACLATYFVAGHLQPLLKILPTVSDTIKSATFSDSPKQGEIEAINVALAFGWTVATAAAVLIFRRTS